MGTENVGSSIGGAQPDQVENYRDGATAQARADVVAAVSERKKRGRPPGSTAGSPVANARAAQQAEVAAKLAELFKPEVWEPLCTLPADAMLAITGNKIWELPEAQRKGLSASTATAMQYVGLTDPKWLAITVMAINWMTVYLPRTVKHFSDKKKESAK